MRPVLVCRLDGVRAGVRRSGKRRRCFACSTRIVLSAERARFLEGRPDAVLCCIGCVPRDAELLGPGRTFSIEELSAKTGVELVKQIALGGDTRFEEGHVPPSELGGTCSRCGSSYIAREGSEGLCRGCAAALARQASGPPAPRPEVPPLVDATRGGPAVESAPTCSVEDCCRVPFARGYCKTHLELASPRVDKPKEEAVAVKRKTVRCGIGDCEFESDWAPALGRHKATAHGQVRPSGSRLRRGETTAAASSPVEEEARASAALDGDTQVSKEPPAPETASPPKPLGGGEPSVAPLGGDLALFDLVLVLRDLEPKTRARLLRWAVEKWGTA